MLFVPRFYIQGTITSWGPVAARREWPGVADRGSMNLSVAGNDVNMAAEESAVLGSVARQRLVKSQETEKS
jgi:hypothetical protein